MKKLLYAVLMVLIASSSYAAPSASTVWEIRGDATANNVNGCGFVTGATGSDYSQQTAAQKDHNDLIASAASSSYVSSAAHPFDAADVGNIIHITAGTNWTTGWYEIVSVSSGTATLDRTATGAGWTSEAGTYYLGGACSFNSTLDDDFFDQIVAGQTAYIRSGSTVTIGEAITAAVAGTETTPIKIIGYNATSGRSVRPTGTDRPSLSAAVALTMANYYRIQDLILTSTYSGGAVLNLGTYNVTDSVKVNCNTTTACIQTGASGMIINSEISNASTAAPAASSGNLVVNTNVLAMGNYIHGGGVSVRTTGAGGRIINNVITGPTRTAIYSSTALASLSVIGNTLYGQATPSAPAIDLNAPANHVIMNNIMDGFTIGTVSATNFGSSFIDYNLYTDVTNTYSGTTSSYAGGNESNMDPVLDVGSSWAITNNSARSLAFPRTFPGLSTNYLDHGALQKAPSSGGGGGASAW